MYEGNILFIKDGSPEGGMSAKWLCEWPAQALADAGYFVDMMNYQDVPKMSRAQKRVVSHADIIIYERHIDDPWLEFLEKASEDKRLILTLDDAYWCSDPTTTTYSFWSQNNRLEKLEEVASWSEKVVVPSRKLAEHFPNGHFRPNRPNLKDPSWVVPPLFSDDVILWGGTMGHISGMRDHPFLEAVSRICEREDAKFVGFAGSPDLKVILEEIPNARVYTAQPFGEWLKFLSGAMVVACPISGEYDLSRSWIKALEASLAGSVWVGSDCGVYDGAAGGLLVEDSADAWEDAMMTVLEDRGMRSKLMEEGKVWAWKQGVHDHLDEWEEIFNDSV
jgi:glycosyltransferase involved in cell wall biosynthesis